MIVITSRFTKTVAPLLSAVRDRLKGSRLSRRLLVRGLLVAMCGFLLMPYILVLSYLVFDPPVSALMARQWLSGRPVRFVWRDLDQISPALINQVIVSEDARFCSHSGVDWQAIRTSLAAAEDGKPRGASTITMQTAKNLFLWSRPAILRKPLELPLAYFMDLILGKRRVMELYLNIAEWGPGVFGAEAAAQYHFNKTAADLDRQDAAQLAAALPNPSKRDAGNPGPMTAARANRLRARSFRGKAAAECVL